MNLSIFRSLVLSTLLIHPVFGKEDSSDKSPNVLFIAIDDMNDWVGFLDGHPQAKTPNMDRLAKRGVNFSFGKINLGKKFTEPTSLVIRGRITT